MFQPVSFEFRTPKVKDQQQITTTVDFETETKIELCKTNIGLGTFPGFLQISPQK